MKKRSFLNKCTRVLAAVMAAGMVFVSVPQMVNAEDEEPFDTYNYDYWEDVVYTPTPYQTDGLVNGIGLTFQGEEIGAFNNPQDLCKDELGNVYVADTGRQRVVKLDPTLTKVLMIYETFTRDGEEDGFNNPTGVCVSQENKLYIADSMNRRVVILDVETGEYLGKVDNPQSDILEAGYVFTPLKVTVDYADRVYCVAQNMFQGIMVFEADGQFTGFFGTIDVTITLWEKFWKKIASKEERNKSQLFIPTEFTGIDVDEDGFVYATNIDENGEQGVRRLNPKGEDVIKKGENSNVGGDLWINGSSDYSGPSQIADVVYRGKGIYSVLDRKRGRIFTYDHEGNLLYIFGGRGTQEGTFASPVAIETIGEDIVVLDALRNSIILFRATEYGSLINEAVALRYDGDETLAVEKWRQVLKLNENFELANVGIGKAYLTAKDNESAMHYLKLGMDKEYYSIAFKRYRNEILKSNLSGIMTGVIIIIVGFVVYSKWRAKHPKDNKKVKEKQSDF